MSDVIPPYSEVALVERRRSGESRFVLPAPVRGLNRKDSQAAMAADYALELINLFPGPGYLETRKGYTRHAGIRVTDGFIQDTVPPQLASQPPALIIRPGREFEIPLLSYLVAELEPIAFTIHEIHSADNDSDWLRITEHGVLYGFSPLPPFTQTYRAELRALDPARNTLRFVVTLIVLPRLGLLGRAVISSVVRDPATSQLATATWAAVTNAERYRVERRQEDGEWQHYATVTSTEKEIYLPGDGWDVRVRPEADGYVTGGWGEFEVDDPGDPEDMDDEPEEQLDTPASLRTSRFPASHSTLVLVEFDSVHGAPRYEVRHRNDAAADWVVVTEMTSADLLVLPGEDHEVQVRAIADEDSFLTDSDWSASNNVTDQTGKPILVPEMTVSRASGNKSNLVTISAPAVPTGVTSLAYQSRRNGGAWGVVAVIEGTSAIVSLTGSGLEVRWAPFTVMDGYAENAAGEPVAIPDQEALDDVRNFAATRVPDVFDATSRFTWGQVEYATGYQVTISKAGEADQVEDVSGRTTTQLDVELDGAGFTATIKAEAPSDWIDSVVSSSISVPDKQNAGPTAFAGDLTATRSVAHEKRVSFQWTPDELATAQTLQVHQGDGVWADPPGGAVALVAADSEAGIDLVGSGWVARIQSTDAANENGDSEVAVPDQDALGRHRPYRLDNGSRTYDAWVRDNQQDLGLVNMRFEREAPRSGAAGTIRTTAGGRSVDLTYDADSTDDPSVADTETQAYRTAEPGVIATLADRPGDDFVAGADQSVSLPARVAMEISGLGITRPDPATLQFGERVPASDIAIPPGITASQIEDVDFGDDLLWCLIGDAANSQSKIQAVNPDGTRNSARDFNLPNYLEFSSQQSIACNDTHLWVMYRRAGSVPANGLLTLSGRAYNHATGQADADKDFSVNVRTFAEEGEAYFFIPGDAFIAGGTLYVEMRTHSGGFDDYDLIAISLSTLARDASSEISPHSSSYGSTAASDGTTMWSRGRPTALAAGIFARVLASGADDDSRDIAPAAGDSGTNVRLSVYGDALHSFNKPDEKTYAYRIGGSTSAASNKNVALTWTHATDRDNRDLYDIEIESRDVGAADWEDATIITAPVFDTATGRWTAVCDADQRDGMGELTTTRKQFRVRHAGYNTTPQLGAAYDAADSNLIENTAPNHDAPIFTT